MTSKSRILGGLLIGTFACTAALADTVAVQFTGRVVDVWDPANVLTGQATLGQQVTGTYNYDTTPTDQDPSWNAAQYSQGPGMSSVSVSAGPLTFASSPGGSSTLYVLQSAWVGNWPGEFQIYYSGNQPLANGASVDTIHFDFLDGNGQMPATPAIPTGTPDLQAYEGHQVDIWGGLGSNSYQVRIQIESAALAGQPAFEISPAAGRFLAPQRFDAALIMPAGKSIAHVSARANGNLLPLEYPGVCQLALPNSLGRVGVVCPQVQMLLPQLPPSTPIEWNVHLTDGTVLTETVLWEWIH